jgi:hypothetical protein
MVHLNSVPFENVQSLGSNLQEYPGRNAYEQRRWEFLHAFLLARVLLAKKGT